MTELLLVEDDPVIVSTLSDFLRSEGFSVSVAGGQRQAMAQLPLGISSWRCWTWACRTAAVLPYAAPSKPSITFP